MTGADGSGGHVERVAQAGLLGRLLCRLGFHDYTWTVTMTDPQLNWRECDRCGHIEEEFRHHFDRYQEADLDG